LPTLSLVLLIATSCTLKEEKEILYFGIPADWGETVAPHLQNSYYSGFVIRGTFDSLFATDKTGATVPVAAKDWSVSEDYKTYTFEIDTSKRFSDGSYLKAQDVKNAWVFAIRANPNGYNSNVGDLFYRVEGIENVQKTGDVSGIQVLSDSRITLKFKKPFRKALSELKGPRFAISKKVGEKFIGTGPYIISNFSKENVILAPNPYSQGHERRKKISINIVKFEDVVNKMEAGQLDYFFAGGLNSRLNYDPNHPYIRALFGQANGHNNLALNGMKGRFFADIEMRTAFQALVAKVIADEKLDLKDLLGVTQSFQVFLPYQSGHLDKAEEEKLIGMSAINIEKLIEATQKKPLVVYYDPDFEILKKKLEDKGVKFSPDSVNMIEKKVNKLDLYYKEFTPDIMSLKASFSNGDPDGIYHLLGKNGAITSPMIYRESVAKLVEEGRDLIDPQEMDQLYSKVSREILKQVPFVHLGFLPSVCIYNSKTLEPVAEIIDRNENFLDGFNPK
jgi:ABC-type transport system substrate-binding protein